MSNEFVPIFLLFARYLGFFLFSPFFVTYLNPLIRICLATAFSLASFSLFQDQTIEYSHSLVFFLLVIKEILVGYLLGFLFSLLFEAAAFAGQLITTMGGFSAVEIFDIRSNKSNPLFSHLFSLTAFILFLSLDLHHFLFRLINESFSLFPIGKFPFNEEVILTMITAVGKMFHYALSYALWPFFILFSIQLIFALFSKEVMIFLNGFPIQIFVTFLVVSLSLSQFDKILIENFSEFFSLAKKVLFSL